MGGPAVVNWDEVEVPAVEDKAAQAAVEGAGTEEAGLSESFDSAAEVTAEAVEAVPVAVPDAPAPTL